MRRADGPPHGRPARSGCCQRGLPSSRVIGPAGPHSAAARRTLSRPMTTAGRCGGSAPGHDGHLRRRRAWAGRAAGFTG